MSMDFIRAAISQIKMLFGAIMFALGMYRWYDTPEARELLDRLN